MIFDRLFAAGADSETAGKEMVRNETPRPPLTTPPPMLIEARR